MTLICGRGARIRVIYANYGRRSSSVCRVPRHRTCYQRNSLSIMRRRCDGRSSCTVTASNSIFRDPCSGIGKYLEVRYQCQSTYRGRLLASREAEEKTDISEELTEEENTNERTDNSGEPSEDENASERTDNSGEPSDDENASERTDNSGEPSDDENAGERTDNSGEPSEDENASERTDNSGEPSEDGDTSERTDNSGEPTHDEDPK